MFRMQATFTYIHICVCPVQKDVYSIYYEIKDIKIVRSEKVNMYVHVYI